MISKVLVAIVLSFSTFTVSAQNIDSQLVMQKYDQNQDQYIDKREFSQLKDLAPYSYANIFQGKNSHDKIFQQLDQNGDGKLSVLELQNMDQSIENQYIGWLWTLDANHVL